MPRQAGTSVETNFTKGLITEVTGVNSPENSVVETDNVIYDRKGRATRRLGMEYEDGFAGINLDDSTTNSGVIAKFLWETISNVGAIQFVVLQFANKLLFFTSDGGPISPNKKSFEIDLLSFKVSVWADSDVTGTQCSFAAGDGKLFVTHSFCDSFYVKYDVSTDTITTTVIDIETRDFDGIVDEVGDSPVRPTTLTILHKYNLWNQGWSSWASLGGGPSPKASIDAWRNDGFTTRSDYPGNQDVWWYYKTTVQAGPNTVATPDKFRNTQVDAVAVGNTPAPTGHYIFSAWQTARSTVTDDHGLAFGGTVPESSSAGARPSVVSFYYGRVFYAGVKADKFASNIYFTRIIEKEDHYGQCYQQNDPTSEKAFDLLPSDGGVIKIPDIVNIIDMRVFGPSIFVFATNGVWSITGSNNSSFKATDYKVQKVCSYPAIARNNIVDVGGSPIWWNNDAMYTLQRNDVSTEYSAQNISLQTIQTLFNSIPSSAKVYADGGFNELEGIVYWLYRTAATSSAIQNTQFDHILVFDIVTSAFYTFSFPSAEVFISGLVPVTLTNDHNVFKFLVTGSVGSFTNGFTFGELSNLECTDWEIETGGTDWDSYFITGYRVRGDLLRTSQANYLTVITEDNPLSSCFMQGIWDYTTSPDTGRYTNPQQMYKTRFYYAKYHRVKVKVRGQGYSLQLKFYSEGRSPFALIGWAAFETVNAAA